MSCGCHNCPHDAEIAKLRETCLKCTRCNGDHVKVASWSRVSLDAARDDGCRGLILGRTARDYRPRDPTPCNPVNIPDDVYQYLMAVLEPFAGLDNLGAALVCAMLRGETLTEIARREGVTLQAMHSRWKTLLRRNPIWAAIANGMIGSGRGRKPGKTPGLPSPCAV